MSKYIIAFFILFTAVSCERFVELTPPDTSLLAEKVYQSDISAISAVTSILGELGGYSAFSQGYGGISIVSGLTADELNTVSQQLSYQQVFTNTLLSNNDITSDIWNRAYKHIYSTNAIIEGTTKSAALSDKAKNQVLGEAYFLRAFMYFQLVNLFGELPLMTGTDYQQNLAASRQPVSKILQQMVDDLTKAQSMLSASYNNNANQPTNARIRPNKWAATALLARVYLYQQDWPHAEAQATEVISQNATYVLDPNLNNVFKPSSPEAIWHLPPGIYNAAPINYTGDGYSFSVTYIKSFGLGPQSFGFDWSNYLNDDLVALFEPGDKRRSSWIDSLAQGGKKYYVPFKYKNGADGGGTLEYLMVLRLAEQYMIRAEARLKQNNTAGARQDIDAVRTRAGLAATTATTPPEIMAAIEKEKQLELFQEWGQRWMDLKRWPGITNPGISRAEEVMAVVTPKKGGVWSKNWLKFPIPVNDIRNGPNMKQNEGYIQ
jgi:hypothetical protein